MTPRLPTLSTLMVTLTLPFLFACASGGGAPAGPTDEELITQMMQANLAALASGDVDSVIATYSDDFSSDQGMDRAGMQQFLQGAADQGFLEGMTSDTTGMSITVAGDIATVEGIMVEGAFGALTLGFGLEKRDGQWVVTSSTQQ